mgnify:CR=1 FL=1
MGNEIAVCHSVWGYAIVCSSAGQGGPSIYFIKVYRKRKEPAIGKNYQSETQTKLVIVSRLEGHRCSTNWIQTGSNEIHQARQQDRLKQSLCNELHISII